MELARARARAAHHSRRERAELGSAPKRGEHLFIATLARFTWLISCELVVWAKMKSELATSLLRFARKLLARSSYHFAEFRFQFFAPPDATC